MARPTVLLTDAPWDDYAIEREILENVGADLQVAAASDLKSLREAAERVDAILVCWAQVDRSIIESAARCRIIARLGIGLDNIDVAAATAAGMLVTNVPDYCQQEVALHTIGLVLALNRSIARQHQATKAGDYDAQLAPTPRRLCGQVLGLIGCGRIGREVARLGAALGLDVIAATRTAAALPSGVRRTSLDDLLAASDYVSLHVPLDPTTAHLIDARALARMKPTASLINTARGGLVDHRALADALSNDRLAGAALDVQEPEPPDLDAPPYCDPRVIVTPHMAFASQESVEELRSRAARQVADFLLGKVPEHVVSAPLRGD